MCDTELTQIASWMIWLSWATLVLLFLLGIRRIPRKQLALIAVISVLHPAILQAFLPCDSEIHKSLILFVFAGIVVFIWGALEQQNRHSES